MISLVSIPVTDAERAENKLTPEHRAQAIQAVHDAGAVVLENVVSQNSIHVLREKMFADLQAFMARPDAPYNFNTGNVQQDPPPFPPYLFQDVLLNDLVIDVTEGVLGKGLTNSFYSGNTAVKSEQRQPVHADTGQLWSGMEHASPAYCLVVNVPVVDMSATNGSTEIWLGTHKDTTVSIHDDIKVTSAALEKWRAVTGPIQPSVKAGDVIIRDIRLWHAGMPNTTDTPRPMIAMIHSAGWYGYAGKLKFPKGTEEFFQHPRLRTLIEFVDGDIDYIAAPHAYDYDPTKKG
jgi:ectoine hydroxylase-related dioxygenase (phytanoyl-CoA dioxygenase family)